MQRIYGTAFRVGQGSEGPPHADRGSEEARPSQARSRARAVHVPSSGRPAPRSGSTRERRCTTRSPNYMRDVLFPAGYVEVKTPLVYNKALWERSGHWKHYRQNMFLIESEGETMSMKPMNCPGHFLTFASTDAQLPRSARALPRADAAASQRSVGRALRADARPAVLAGRCALLRDAGADRRGGRAADSARAARVQRLRPAVHRQALDEARRVPRRDRDVGPRGGAAEGGARRAPGWITR